MALLQNKWRIQIIALAVFLVFVALIPSCKKEQPISSTPALTFESMSPNPAVKYVDTISIVISYIDGDGDLGIDSADVKNLYVTDSRNNVASAFRIPQLAPSGSAIAIEGKWNIVLPAQAFTNDNDTTETATYSIYCTDRAGHVSNTIKTSALVIRK